MPRPAPDLDLRRGQVTHATRTLAEAEGWSAVTMRRLASELGVTQPVIYSAFEGGRQALIDAVSLQGFDDLADALEAVDASPTPRIRAYLQFAAAHPRTYEAMFSLPSGLRFAADDTPESMRRAFAAIQGGFPAADETHAEVAWSVMHGLATLSAGGRLRPDHVQDRLALAHQILGREVD